MGEDIAQEERDLLDNSILIILDDELKGNTLSEAYKNKMVKNTVTMAENIVIARREALSNLAGHIYKK